MFIRSNSCIAQYQGYLKLINCRRGMNSAWGTLNMSRIYHVTELFIKNAVHQLKYLVATEINQHFITKSVYELSGAKCKVASLNKGCELHDMTVMKVMTVVCMTVRQDPTYCISLARPKSDMRASTSTSSLLPIFFIRNRMFWV